ncbi:hypothetical protein [Pyxidicoccus trucidator]|uniref:hypothetical protein n=1 Tax=Pyxidicoccus trucidator TaxID=2709662 RepID=UPI0013DC0A81|nr:hypothetical protein [Pyxidicoccus trucidator]
MAVAPPANRIPSRTVVLGGMGNDDASGLSARLLTVLEGALALPGYRFERLEDARPEDLQTNRWSQRDGPVILVGVVGDVPSLEQEYDRAEAAGGTCLMFALRGRSRSRFEERLLAERGITEFVDSPEELLQELVRAVRAWEQNTLGGLLLEGQRFRVLHGVPRFEPVRVDELVPHRGKEEVLVFHGPPGPELKRIALDYAASRAPLRFLREDVPVLPELLKPYFGNQEALFVEEVDQRPARETHALVRTLSDAPPRNRDEGPRLVLTTRTSRLGALKAMLLGQGFQARDILVQALPVSDAPEEPRPADDGAPLAPPLEHPVNQPWVAPEVSAAVTAAAEEQGKNLGDSLELVLVGDFPRDDQGKQLLQERLDQAARTLLDACATPEEALARLTWSIRGLRDAGHLPRVWDFFQTVASISPQALLHWGQVMMREPTHPLRDDMEALLWPLVHSEPELARVLVDALREEGHEDLLMALGFGPKYLEVLGAERLLAIHERLLTHPERAVRVAAFKRVGNDSVLAGEVLARLLLTHRGSDIEEPATAKVWALAVGSFRVYDACRVEDKEALAAALRAPRSLGPWCHFLLQRLATDVPAALVDLMLARIEASAEAGADHEAVPVMEAWRDPPYQQLPPEERQRAVAVVERLLEHKHSAVRAQARRWLADLVVVKPPRPGTVACPTPDDPEA